MPAIYNIKTLELLVSKRSINLHYCFSHVRNFVPNIKFSETLQSNVYFDEFNLFECLSKCRLQKARELLDQMPQRGNSRNVVYWTSLLSKFAKDGFINEAQVLFDIMPVRNVVTYNAMLSGYVQFGRLNDAFRLFEVMPERNVVSWTSMLCGFMNAGMVEEGMRFFYAMPERNVVSWNSMVAGLIRSGLLEEARRVFDSMPEKNQISWNAMICGYADNCRMEEARALFDEVLDRNVITWTSLITGYCRIGDVEEAYLLFNQMPERNIVSWTAMIRGFTWNGFYKEALLLFLEMRRNNTKPNQGTFIPLAYACSGIGFPRLGKQLHATMIINSWDCDEFDETMCKSLIHMYSVLGVMDYAHYIFFKNFKTCTVQSLNSMINGYIGIGQLEKAENLFNSVHARDKISWTSMINGYFNVGEVRKACDLFKRMPFRDAVSWTVMISGHIQHELCEEAMCLFLDMRTYGISPLNSTYSVLLGAVGAVAYLDQGKQFHCLVFKTQNGRDLIRENSLISMYAKCGEIDDAYKIFSNMVYWDLISWNSMIMGFSHHGLPNEALELFKTMVESGIHPNKVTFLGVLSACNHGGLVEKGWELFNAMSDEYSIQLGLEHFISMINLLGRAGKVEEAEEFVLKLPFEPSHAVWGALLGVCGFGEKNAGIARHAAKRVLELDPLNAPAHVALCNAFAAAGEHVEQRILRRNMGLKGVKKIAGCSWILLQGRVHLFLSGDRSHLQSEEILLLLYRIVEESKLIGSVEHNSIVHFFEG